jgi:tetratricopeptide (TPR) repeat protein
VRCPRAFALVVAVALACGRASADDGGAAGGDAQASAVRARVGDLTSSDAKMRRAAARSIDGLGAQATHALAIELAHARHLAPAADVAALLARVQAFGDASGARDRLDAVLDLSPEGLGPTYLDAAATLCLMRALADIGTPDAVAAFAPVALDARGAFLPDVEHHLEDLGERATAGLILARHASSPAEAKWAATTLETRGTRTPGDAVQTKSKEVLADILAAYGRTHDLDALSVVASFDNADRRLIRDAARGAIVEYGDLAAAKLRESYGLLSGQPAPADWPVAFLRERLFVALDKVRLEDVAAHEEEGLALVREERYAEAVERFRDVLARQPDWDRRAEMAPAFVLDAESLLDTDPVHARELLDDALRLDPTGPRADQAKSALSLLEGRDLESHGVVDLAPYKHALALDPGNFAAAAAIARIEDAERQRQKTWQLRAALAGAALVVFALLVLFVGPRRRGKTAGSRAPRR